MIIVMKPESAMDDALALRARLGWMGLEVGPVVQHDGRLSLAVVGRHDGVQWDAMSTLPGVERVVPFTRPFKLAGRELNTERAVVQVGSVEIGGGRLAVVAGPCSVESEEQIHTSARLVAAAGASLLRGGAFKPRTSPYDFQGLGEEGLRMLRDAGRAHGLPVVSEIMDLDQLDLLYEYCDMLQVGARNMQNFTLLKGLGRTDKPVLLKRGLSATYQELLMSAEYVLAGGNHRIVLCERGIRTFETFSRNTLDLAAVPILKELSHLPVIVDPSHGTGLRRMVTPMARAAVAAGADGIMVEVHPEPDRALSDGQQTLTPVQFTELMATLRIIAPAVGVEVPPARPAG
ncbi:MAG TPA: 3-deoxy-7-phosphoheptulonate synthase [Thermoanaerobaculaceae bacterium]|nr:3-deoxy-7-phosphoheptulonate synthase [Thermoanaerobaculaceae bacterium]HRS16130.1 3-deoxy-7-phosphoheptulonate synthase [Thermoanaerobaculaceae bacterium]